MISTRLQGGGFKFGVKLKNKIKSKVDVQNLFFCLFFFGTTRFGQKNSPKAMVTAAHKCDLKNLRSLK